MVPQEAKIKSAKQLKGATVCVQSGTTTEKNLTDYSKRQQPEHQAGGVREARGRDQAPTSPAAATPTPPTPRAWPRSATRTPPNPADHVILPELISKEPLGPMVRRGDDEWFAIVKWVIYGLIEAEEYGITQANVDEMKTSSTDPVVKRILGTAEDTGKLLGLDKDWMATRHQGRRQLRRDLRAQRRPEVAAGPAARPEQPVEQGRPDVRLPGALNEHAMQLLPDVDATRAPRIVHDGSRAGRAAAASRRERMSARHPAQEALVLAQPGFRGMIYQVLAHRRLIGAGGLVPGSQHAGQHAGARHPERLRLPQPAGRLRHRREPVSLRLGRALLAAPSLVGLTNTLRVAVLGIMLATILGTLLGVGRLFAQLRWCAGCARPMSSCSATSRCCCSC